MYSKIWWISYFHLYGALGGGDTSLAAAGTIYKIDKTTGSPSVFAVIPGQQTMSLGGGFMSGPGIGNIAYDTVNDHSIRWARTPYDPSYTATAGPDVKGSGGDVEIMRSAACAELEVVEISHFPSSRTGLLPRMSRRHQTRFRLAGSE